MQCIDSYYTIWMDTIKEGRFDDTNQMFVKPNDADLTLSKYSTDDDLEFVVKELDIIVLKV